MWQLASFSGTSAETGVNCLQSSVVFDVFFVELCLGYEVVLYPHLNPSTPVT